MINGAMETADTALEPAGLPSGASQALKAAAAGSVIRRRRMTSMSQMRPRSEQELQRPFIPGTGLPPPCLHTIRSYESYTIVEMKRTNRNHLICQLPQKTTPAFDKLVCDLKNFRLSEFLVPRYTTRGSSSFCMTHIVHAAGKSLSLLEAHALMLARGSKKALERCLECPSIGAVGAGENRMCWQREVGMRSSLTPAPALPPPILHPLSYPQTLTEHQLGPSIVLIQGMPRGP
uniref:Uncharacterized protein LOC123619218 isoform X1 n=1 Tax=Camelus bactrianus TaxID=9837 RepID=A0A9W3GHN0_CAMBA|nr:uncharacterized protein LOC123619218 isoform X1 [Camelus bactrianus]